MRKQIPFGKMMLEVPSSRDLRDSRQRVAGELIGRRLAATRATAWQLAFRRWFRPPICQRVTED